MDMKSIAVTATIAAAVVFVMLKVKPIREKLGVPGVA
jgi:hypothetical protein